MKTIIDHLVSTGGNRYNSPVEKPYRTLPDMPKRVHHYSSMSALIYQEDFHGVHSTLEDTAQDFVEIIYDEINVAVPWWVSSR